MRTIITSIICLFCLSASAQNIVLDPYFGNDGIAFVENTSGINKLALNPDGSIVSAGITITGGNFHLTLSKHYPDGMPDLNFGTGGITQTVVSYSETVLSLQLQADGKILVAGAARLIPSGGNEEYNSFVVRYHPGGTIDSSFATNGIFLDTNHNDSEFNSIIVQNDQSLLLLGNADGRSYLMKLTSDGEVDTAFGTNGITYISDFSTYIFYNQGSTRLADGSILCYGTEFLNSNVTCAKIDSLGNFISSFGQGGKASFDLDATPNLIEILSKAQELPDGKIILAGITVQGTVLTDQFILKLKSDGTIDSSFATNGLLSHSLPFKDMFIQPDGKILIGGSKLISTDNYGISISRFNTDGTIDPGFNGTGTFEADLSERSDYLQCIVLVDSDHLLTGGSAKIFDQNSIFALAQIDMSQTLGLQVNKSEEISLYPNPFTGELTISTGDDQIKEIQLKDASGRLIGNYPANTTLFLDHLSVGMYQVVFVNDRQESISRKLIKT
jgi:uncharacterized delta-60 repeat protein